MNILSVCDNPDILKVIRIVKIIVTIIKVAVPILLLLSVSITYLKSVKDNDSDSIQKANKNTVAKVVAAILIFFIPTFVGIISRLTGSDGYVSCFDVATKEGITSAYTNNARVYIENAKNSIYRN